MEIPDGLVEDITETLEAVSVAALGKTTGDPRRYDILQCKLKQCSAGSNWNMRRKN